MNRNHPALVKHMEERPQQLYCLRVGDVQLRRCDQKGHDHTGSGPSLDLVNAQRSQWHGRIWRAHGLMCNKRIETIISISKPMVSMLELWTMKPMTFCWNIQACRKLHRTVQGFSLQLNTPKHHALQSWDPIFTNWKAILRRAKPESGFWEVLEGVTVINNFGKKQTNHNLGKQKQLGKPNQV